MHAHTTQTHEDAHTLTDKFINFCLHLSHRKGLIEVIIKYVRVKYLKHLTQAVYISPMCMQMLSCYLLWLTNKSNKMLCELNIN